MPIPARDGIIARSFRGVLKRCLLILVLCPTQIGCFATTIGDPGHQHDWSNYQFGPREQVRVCTWRENGVPADEVDDWIQNWNQKHENEVMLTLVPVDKGELPRGGFTHTEITDSFEKQVPLSNDCDREMYFVGRNVGDFLYGVLAVTTVPLPETLGETEDLTLTHAFVVASRATVMNLVFPPKEITEHEIWHLLGCKQHYNWDRCYAQVAALKMEQERLIQGGYFGQIGEKPFYPTWDNLSDRFLVSRAEVNSHLTH
jgi:hypothetical protein